MQYLTDSAMVGGLSGGKRRHFREHVYDVTSLLLGRWRLNFTGISIQRHYGRKPTTLTILTTPFADN